MALAVENNPEYSQLHPWETAGGSDGYSHAVVGIERIHQLFGEWKLSKAYAQQFMPEDQIWENPIHVYEKENPHNKAHNPRVAIAAYYIALYEFCDRPEQLTGAIPIIFETLKWHDVRQGRDDNNPHHGAQAAELFRIDPQTREKYSMQEIDDIVFLITHHSDREYPPDDEQLHRLKEIFDIIRDADACELTRAPLHVPVEEIELHTIAAKIFHLPDIMRLVQIEADCFDDCDIVEAQWRAARVLGLISYES